MEPQGNKELLDKKVPLVLKVSKVPQAKMDLQVNRVLEVSREP